VPLVDMAAGSNLVIGILLELGEYRWTGIPAEPSGTPRSVLRAPPEFNQHSDEILADAGFSSDEIAALRLQNVVGRALKHRSDK
jgi:crotonobetainyl-CoA:carnitine CoA-transferase CaiB-like acyl-CoA transferase